MVCISSPLSPASGARPYSSTSERACMVNTSCFRGACTHARNAQRQSSTHPPTAATTHGRSWRATVTAPLHPNPASMTLARPDTSHIGRLHGPMHREPPPTAGDAISNQAHRLVCTYTSTYVYMCIVWTYICKHAPLFSLHKSYTLESFHSIQRTPSRHRPYAIVSCLGSIVGVDSKNGCSCTEAAARYDRPALA